MVNQEVLDLPVDLSCIVLPTIKSDHSPILINFSSRIQSQQRRPNIFRYEVAWEVREEGSNRVKDTLASNSISIHGKLTKCKEALINWRRSIRQEEINDKQVKLSQIGKVQQAKWRANRN